MRDFTILTLSNSLDDLTKVKFDEFEIVNCSSLQFQTFLKNSFVHQSIIDDLNKYQESEIYDRFAIIHKEKVKFGPKKIYDIYNFLLILFPSTLTVDYIVDFQVIQDELRFSSIFKTKEAYSQDEEKLSLKSVNIELVNDFIKNYYKEHLKVNYLKFSIQNYINAFDSNYYHFSFIAFCISLESITNGNSELLYRLARNIAVICGKDANTSDIIFKNIKKIYSLRSKIVHGADFDDDLVSDYLYYLECIVSKTITELLIHNISSIDILNHQITKIGFGNRTSISDNWKDYSFNPKIEDIIYTELIKQPKSK